MKKIETSIQDQTVTIEYDADKTNVEKIVEAFKKFGYEAEPVMPDKEEKCCNQSESGSCGKCH